MTLRIFDWSGGTPGAAATQANTGTAPLSPVPGAGGSITHTNDDGGAPGNGLLFTNGTTATCIVPVPLTPNTKQELSWLVKLPATAPPSNFRLAGFQNAGLKAYIHLTSGWVIVAGGQSGSAQGNCAGGASMAAYADTWIRIEAIYDSGTTTSNGKWQVRVFPSPFSTSQIGTEFNPGTINTGAGAADSGMNVQLGHSAVVASVLPYTVGYFQANDGRATTFLGPPPTASAPSVNAGVDQYPVAGATITLASTESGTFSAGAWSCTRKPDDAPTVSITAPANATTTAVLPSAGSPATPVGGQYDFTRTLTWTGGTVTDTLTVWAAPSSSNDVKVHGELAAQPAWSIRGGSATKAAALNDTSAATGIESIDNPANAEQKIVMRPWNVGPVKVYVEGFTETASVTRTITLYKEDGTTVVDSTSRTPPVGATEIDEPEWTVNAATITGADDAATRILRRALVVGIKSQ